MKCPRCRKDILNIKKYRVNYCSCGAKLIVVEINKKLEIEDVTPEIEDYKKGTCI
jgi:DNA-directed RNA polymerase subunit RPC12/RpoP